MIDYIKTELILPEFNIKSNPLLEKLRDINIDTGEIVGNHCIAQYKNMKFKMYDSGRVFIDGSLHKLKNDGFHNADDFYLEDMQILLDLPPLNRTIQK
jgi:hypothetical protein